jgi:hypothetical protein
MAATLVGRRANNAVSQAGALAVIRYAKLHGTKHRPSRHSRRSRPFSINSLT